MSAVFFLNLRLTVPDAFDGVDVSYMNSLLLNLALSDWSQDNFDCDLCFNIGENAYNIALEQNITELKENHLYIIHINKAGECTIKINDWQDDGSGVIVDKDETN